MEKEFKEEKNIVIIADRPYEVYIQTMLLKFQKFDQIEIQVTDRYIDKALEIIRLWEAVGILSEKGHPIKFERVNIDITTRDGKKYIQKPTNRITLTKLPDLYRFTKSR